MKWFLPKQTECAAQFTQLNACVKEITALFHQYADAFKDQEMYFQRAKEIERKADTITHQIVDRLNHTFITPFDREDIYALAQKMDDLVDAMEKIISDIYMYHIIETKPELSEFSKLMMQASQFLDHLVTECFKQQKHTPATAQWIIKIHEVEDQADLLYQQSLRKLFQEEKDPITVMKWKDIIEDMEEVMDTFQVISDAMESMVVKAG